MTVFNFSNYGFTGEHLARYVAGRSDSYSSGHSYRFAPKPHRSITFHQQNDRLTVVLWRAPDSRPIVCGPVVLWVSREITGCLGHCVTVGLSGPETAGTQKPENLDL
jgi:hypothetical protein